MCSIRGCRDKLRRLCRNMNLNRKFNQIHSAKRLTMILCSTTRILWAWNEINQAIPQTISRWVWIINRINEGTTIKECNCEYFDEMLYLFIWNFRTISEKRENINYVILDHNASLLWGFKEHIWRKSKIHWTLRGS